MLPQASSIRVQGNRFTGDLTKMLDSRYPTPIVNVLDLSHNNFLMTPSEKFPNPLESMLEMLCGTRSLKELRLAGSDLMGKPLPDRLNCREYKQQFLNEVKILAGVNHRHLVKLLGCSMENKIALLVFEFVPNGTLQEHLRGKRQGCSPLTWRQRLLIALQTSDALAYLHSAADPPIFHRDVKSSNILLDDDLSAKVADFGISKLAPSKAATHVSTVAIQGTMGYIDPEYYVSFQLTPRSDVYSFGVVLLELISAKPVVDFQRGCDETSLANLALSAMDRGEWEELIDPVLADIYNSSNGKALIDSVGALAMRCLALRSRERPGMREVWKELQTVWLHSDASYQSDRVRHYVQPQNAHGDVDDSYDHMSPQSPYPSMCSSSSTSGPEIEMHRL